MQKRRRFKQTTSLQDRLSEFVNTERAKAESVPESDQYELQKKIRQAETREHREMGGFARIAAADRCDITAEGGTSN